MGDPLAITLLTFIALSAALFANPIRKSYNSAARKLIIQTFAEQKSVLSLDSSSWNEKVISRGTVNFCRSVRQLRRILLNVKVL